MQRINTPNGLFTEGNPATNTRGTIVTSTWLNALQEEIMAVIEGAGLKPSGADLTQLWQALLISFAAAQSGKGHFREAWIIDKDVPAGSIYTLQGDYYPGTDTLFLLYDGVPCTPKKNGVAVSGKYQYEEVGTDPKVLSNQIKVNFNLAAGTVIDMLCFGSGGGGGGYISPPAGPSAPSGDTAITSQFEVLSAVLPAGANYAVPAYIPGKNKLQVSLDGVRAYSQVAGDKATFRETGPSGMTSFTIQFLFDLPGGKEILVEAIS